MRSLAATMFQCSEFTEKALYDSGVGSLVLLAPAFGRTVQSSEAGVEIHGREGGGGAGAPRRLLRAHKQGKVELALKRKHTSSGQ